MQPGDNHSMQPDDNHFVQPRDNHYMQARDSNSMQPRDNHSVKLRDNHSGNLVITFLTPVNIMKITSESSRSLPFVNTYSRLKTTIPTVDGGTRIC